MNESRQRDILNTSGKPENTLEEDWDALRQCVNDLEDRVKPFYRRDILSRIIQQKIVLRNNKPNKKTYRAVLRIAEGIEKEVNDLGGRSR